MKLATILRILQNALALVGITGQIAADIRANVATVIRDAEVKTGKQLADMSDDELAELLEHDTATVDDLIGDVD